MTSVSIAWGICSRFGREYEENREEGIEGGRERGRGRGREEYKQVCCIISLPVGTVTDTGEINAASN
jgi:predicted transposase YdaD